MSAHCYCCVFTPYKFSYCYHCHHHHHHCDE